MTLRFGQEQVGSSPAAIDASVAARVRPVGSPALVVGFGDVLPGDAGVGARLAERLRSVLKPGAAEFVDGDTLGFSLLSYIEATDSLLVLDSADLHGAPGTIRLFEGAAMDRFLGGIRRRTVSELGLVDLLDMARLIDCLPSRRALLCIQPGRIDWSETLSAPVAKALPEAAARAQALLENWRSA